MVHARSSGRRRSRNCDDRAGSLARDRLYFDLADLGEIGLALAESYRDYDVIVLDLVLPDVMGYDLIRSLRAAGVDTPILIVSSPRNGSAMALDLGANDFLPKPFDEADLIARIRAVAAQPRAA
ncbi:MAG TPA: response regulator [Stellaceae bacterium]|nr:response regulator [Stellaceae bacterium]